MNLSHLFASMFHPAFWIPISVFACGTIIVITVLFFSHQRRKLWHETARVALEKGQPLPPALESYSASMCQGKEPRGPAHDVRSALILIAIGIGLYVGLGGLNGGSGGPHLIGAYICGGIGIALLLNALISVLFSRKSSDVNSRPPQT